MDNSDYEDVELATIFSNSVLDEKEMKTSSQNRKRISKKKAHGQDRLGLWRKSLPDLTIPKANGNQYRREEEKTEALSKFWEWPADSKKYIKHKLPYWNF